MRDSAFEMLDDARAELHDARANLAVREAALSDGRVADEAEWLRTLARDRHRVAALQSEVARLEEAVATEEG